MHLPFPTRTIYLVHLILLDVITLTVFGEVSNYEVLYMVLFLHPPATFCSMVTMKTHK
jgi:hypothetical protein